MTITAIILAHFKERVDNISLIVEDLLSGTVKPERIIIFVDYPACYLDEYEDDRVTLIKSDHKFRPNIRFALGSICETDYCFFIDDDLSVGPKTLENFVNYAKEQPQAILGLEGSILGDTPTPYSNDKCINRGGDILPLRADIIIRTYFVPVKVLPYGLQLRAEYPELPKESLDDIFLCLGNKYLNHQRSYVIPVDKETDLIELNDGGVGQSKSADHYNNRNITCRKLMDIYE